jgi:uncharacterized protein (DUF697 family)
MDTNTDSAKLSETINELETNLSIVASALRESEAQNIVKNNIITSIASGLIPVPLFDMISLTNIQFHMIQTLADHYQIPADNINKSLVTSLISGSLPVVSMLGLGSFMKSIPGIGTLAGSGSVAIISGAVSYAVGQVFIRHFEQGGTLDDFDPDSVKDYFNEQYKTGKVIARELIQEVKQLKKDKSSKPEETASEDSKTA